MCLSCHGAAYAYLVCVEKEERFTFVLLRTGTVFYENEKCRSLGFH